MKTINLGVEDGLPPVDWDGVVEKVAADSAPDPDGAQRAHEVAHDAQRRRQPARDRGRGHVAGRRVLVPDRIRHPEGPQRRARSAVLGGPVDPRR